MKRHRVPTVLQMEAVECGAASLGMVLGYHGAFVPLEELRYQCGVSRDGTKAGNILRAARTYGLDARGFRKETGQLSSLPLPAILHWNFQHFLVLEGLDGEYAWLNDPASGPRKVPFEVLDESFTGVVLTFEPNDAFEKRGAPLEIWPSLRARLEGSKAALAFAVLVGLVLAIPGLIIPFFTRIFVDEVLVGGKSDWLWPLIAVMALVLLLQASMTALRQSNLLNLRTKLTVSGASTFLWHVLRLEPRFFEARLAGDIASRVALNQELASILSGRLAGAVIDAVMLVLYLLVMLSFDVPLTLVAVGAAALNLLALRQITQHRSILSNRLSRAQANLSGVQSSGLQQIETLKATGAEGRFFARWAGFYAHVVNAQQDASGSSMRLGLIPALLGAVSTAVVLCWGAARVLDGEMTMGSLVAFQALTAAFLGPVQRVLSLWSSMQLLPGTLMRLDDVLQQPAADLTSTGATTPLSGQLTLDGVSFGYSPRDPPLLNGISIQIEPGQRVAFVGGSGSGKSTLAKLVAGTYEPWGGRILFDGTPREAIDRRTLLEAVCTVDQDIVLFEGTVRDNLTLWDDGVPQEDVVRAAKDACIHEHIISLPQGYDTRLEEGGRNLSGGQRQRLEIARALVSNPSMLVLDEATSALDTHLEQQIDRNLRRRGCTCLIVAHRLSTVRDADTIVVMEAGRMVERGTHPELLEQDGVYRRLVGAA